VESVSKLARVGGLEQQIVPRHGVKPSLDGSSIIDFKDWADDFERPS
jgi:hypothetical protein